MPSQLAERDVALSMAFGEWALRSMPPKTRRELRASARELQQMLLDLFHNRVLGYAQAWVKMRVFADPAASNDFMDSFTVDIVDGIHFPSIWTATSDAAKLGYGSAKGVAVISPGEADVSHIVEQQKTFGSQLIKGILRDSGPKINTVISNGIKSGASREMIMDSLLTKIQTSVMPEWRARLISQTEVIRSFNAGSVARYKQAGVTHITWLDGQKGACTECASLHGATIAIRGQFETTTRAFSVDYPPLHPGCRCSTAAATDAEIIGAPEPAPVPKEQPVVLKPKAEPKTNATKPFPKDGFKKITEVEAWAGKRWPNTGFNIRDMDIEYANKLVRQLDVLTKRFPEVGNNLRTFGISPDFTGKGSDSHWAHAHTDGSGIHFNSLWWNESRKGKLEISLANSERTWPGKTLSWHPKGTNTVEGVLSHEFGHMVDAWLSGRTPLSPTYQQAFTDVVRADGFGIIRSTWDKVRESRAINLSEYAKTNSAEKFAEAFSQMMMVPQKQWNPYTKKVSVALEEIADTNKWKNRMEWRWLSDIPIEERSGIASKTSDLAHKLGQ